MRALLAGTSMMLCMVLVLVILPIGLPLGLLWSAWQDRRQRVAADRTRCVRCSTLLAAASVQAATADHIAALGAMQRRYPHGRVNLLRRADARCASCGMTYAWDRRQGLFIPLVDETALAT